jgi:cellulose biosynthesis protein BcsQ
VGPGLSKALYVGSQTTVIMVSDGRLEPSEADYPVLDKYQRGDQMVSQILRIYMEQHPGQRFLNTGASASRLIGVFSPSGGCGKTTVAAGLSVLARQRGKRAMYLNLEGCESTGAWFSEGSGPSISELFYHLKEGAQQLSLKLQALSYTDPGSQVRSFVPADTLMDFNELTDTDLQLLADELRRSADLDLVVVDMAASVDARTLRILELMDQVILVAADDRASQEKVNRFMRQIPVLERKRNSDYTGKTVLACNGRYGLGFNALETDRLKTVCTLPKDPVFRQEGSMTEKLSHPFGNALNALWDKLELG